MRNQATIDFIRQHRKEDVRQLALQGSHNPEVDMTWALEQISGWQTAKRKLPSWTNIESIIYPPHLSMEQCSSEQTAQYKVEVAKTLFKDRVKETLSLLDLTGGFGVDFSFLAQQFGRAFYVERQIHLCDAALHNFPLLGLSHAKVVNAEAEAFLSKLQEKESDSLFSLIYLDPARRDDNGQKAYAINDCTPNILDLLKTLLNLSEWLLLKLSPMLDWHKAVEDLEQAARQSVDQKEIVREVHIVSAQNECKELLILMSSKHHGECTVSCVNDRQSFSFRPQNSQNGNRLSNTHPKTFISQRPAPNTYLYEPNASLMKAGCFQQVADQYGVVQLAPNSHLFISPHFIDNFPGRYFLIETVTTMNKKELQPVLYDIKHANIAVRNFPLSVNDLRKRLKLKDGGNVYIFATTILDNDHILLITRKPSVKPLTSL